MPPSPLEAVLFDVDGTLIDHDAAAREAITVSFPAPAPTGPDQDHVDQDREDQDRVGHGREDQDRVVRRWRELEGWAMDRYLAGELTFSEQRRVRITRLAAEFGGGAWPTAQADDWFAGYLARYEAAWRTYPDVPEALSALTAGPRPFRLGVLTNGDAAQQRRKLRHVGLPALARHATVSSEAGAAKPDPRIFQAACAALGLAPSRVAYVGDRLRRDAEAATAAGLHGIWLDRHATAAAHIVPRITTLTALAPLLTREPPAAGTERITPLPSCG